MTTKHIRRQALDDAEQLGYAEAKEQFATQGSFSSGMTYDSQELSEAYDRGVNRAEAEFQPAQPEQLQGELLQELLADAAQDSGMHPDKINAACDYVQQLGELAETQKTLRGTRHALKYANEQNKRLQQERDQARAELDKALIELDRTNRARLKARAQVAKLLAALRDQLEAIQVWQGADRLPSDVAEGIEISVDKIERAIAAAEKG